MSHILSESAFLTSLFTCDIPLMDVRSPGEFEHGAFPCAYNLPVLDNEQRAQVGTCYKQTGQNDAIALGHKFLSGQTLANRTQAWIEFAQQHPQGYLYCARGGMRSHKVQERLKQQGIDYPLIPGGYKTLRRFLLNTLDQAEEKFEFITLGGPTGSGKTHFLHSFQDNKIDLEGLAHHRGSSFGKRVQPQPTQINFENALAIALLKAEARGIKTLILEDESKLIGRRCLPVNFQKIIKEAPLLLLEKDIESRIKTISNDYILDNLNDYQKHHGEQKGFTLFSNDLLFNLKRISRRLGGERYAKIELMMYEAITQYQKYSNKDAFYPVIQWLLVNYYDPMYNYQLTRKHQPVLLRGSTSHITQWVNANIPDIKHYNIAI